MPSVYRSRVLYLDNDEDTCEMIRLLLNMRGIDVTCVNSADEAAHEIKAKRFDLLLLDVWLPGLNGFEFCRQVRRSDTKTPILFYSGAAYESDKKTGLAAGANAYLCKPDIEGVVSAIIGYIARSRASGLVARAGKARSLASAFSPQFLSLNTAHE